MPRSENDSASDRRRRVHVACIVAVCAVVVSLFAFLVVGVVLHHRGDSSDDDVVASESSFEQKTADGTADDDAMTLGTTPTTLGTTAELLPSLPPQYGLRSARTMMPSTSPSGGAASQADDSANVVPSSSSRFPSDDDDDGRQQPTTVEDAVDDDSPSASPSARRRHGGRASSSPSERPSIIGEPSTSPSDWSTSPPSDSPSVVNDEEEEEDPETPWKLDVTSWIDSFNALSTTSNSNEETGEIEYVPLKEEESTTNPSNSPSEEPAEESTTTDPSSNSPSEEPTEFVTKGPTSTSIIANWTDDAFHEPSSATNSSSSSYCLAREDCDERRRAMGFEFYAVGEDLPLMGCFHEDGVAYFGMGGTEDDMSSPSAGENIRIRCRDGPATATPSSTPSRTLTQEPSSRTSSTPSDVPSRIPTQTPSSRAPTSKPTASDDDDSSPACFSIETYDSIDDDIEILKNDIPDQKGRSHFLGGIVRLAAHDFMDYDGSDPRNRNPMGPDGCIDATHPANAGLPQDIWCDSCPLKVLHEEKYPRVSRADFWIAAANAAIRRSSKERALDMKDGFVWGRVDADSCPGSGDRLPTPRGCDDVEEVFLRRMGLTWRDAVALMGAHTLGRGDREFSGHHGTWVDTDEDAQVFDKQYYEEIYLNSWRPRNLGRSNQDWTTGRPSDGGNARVMLNTDLCLVHDIDGGNSLPCCTSTGRTYPDTGQDACVDDEAARRRCPMYGRSHSRFEATEAVGDMLGGAYPNDNNAPFYAAFAEAWRKATTVGREGLSALAESCES